MLKSGKSLLSGILGVFSCLGLYCVPALAAPPRTGYNLVFSEEFNAPISFYTGAGSTGRWKTWYYSGYPQPEGGDRTLASNHEAQWYMDSNYKGTGSAPLGVNPFILNNGVVSIQAAVSDPVTVRPYINNYQYTSGLLTTQPSFNQTYGYFEIRCKLPSGRGLWPAFWLLPQDKSWPPEIDIIEVLGHDTQTLYLNTHNGKDANGVPIPGGYNGSRILDDMSAGFHTYGVEWTASKITWYYDGMEITSGTTPASMNKPMYMLMNLAVGGTGSWPGAPDANTVFPANYDIDYVRAYALTGATEPTPLEIIKDNSDSTGVTISSGWSASTNTPGYYASNYLADNGSGDGNRQVQWTPTIPSPGKYDVYMRWTMGPNRATNALVTVTHATGYSTLTVNQRKYGTFWVPIGTYQFNAGTAGNVMINNLSADGYVIADAVRFVQRPAATEVILDNTNTSAVTQNGSWTASTTSAGYYGTNFLHDGNTGKGAKSVTFRPNLTASGNYKVYARWAANTNRATHVPIDIITSTGLPSTVEVNQRTSGGTWVLLGTYPLMASSAAVTIRTDGTTDGYVVADAIRFLPE